MIIKYKKNLSKNQIVKNIKLSIGLSTKNLQKITDDIIDIILDNIATHNKLNIKNFGSFYVLYKKQREGRNPKTNEKFTIYSRNTLQFKPSSFLKQKINEL